MSQSWAAGIVADRGAAELLSGVTVLRRSDLRHSVSAWSDLIVADADAASIESGFLVLMRELGGAVPQARVESATDPQLLERVRPVLERLRDEESNPRLDDLAAILGVSRYRLVREVKRATGLSPVAWRQNARIALARRLLREGLPIADTAQELGFTDQSHLHRVFRAHVGASPGAYRSPAQ